MDPQKYREQATAAIDDSKIPALSLSKSNNQLLYYEQLPDLRVTSNVTPGYLRPLLPASAPEEPEPFSDIQADIQSKIMPGLTHWQSPNFMAFFPASSSHPAMVADMYCNAFTGAHFNWICSPAATELETIVLDWLAQALNLPSCYQSTGPTGGGGVIHGSASEAILTVMVAAREKYLGAHVRHLPASTPAELEALEEAKAELHGKLVVLYSAMTHSSTKKAAKILGLRCASVPVKRENGFALKGDDLGHTVCELRDRGLHPFFLTATYGTTDVCAVDDFESIAKVLGTLAHQQSSVNLETQPIEAEVLENATTGSQDDMAGDIWVHVDAAYAGSALILPEYQNNKASGSPSSPAIFERFHSFNFNPHKWLLVNFDCSALYVRRSSYLADALSMTPPYLRNGFSDAGLVTDYRDWQIPLGRRFRALKLWFVMRMFGLQGLREHLRSGISRAEKLAKMLRSRPDLFEIVYGPVYALVVFRLASRNPENKNTDEDDADRAARGSRMYETINAAGKIYLTSSMPGGQFAIRVSTAVASTKDSHIQDAFDILVKEAELLR
ncbi:hypothetical protein Cpir12675_001050 [Ceratocystis pirilliformis]|uniref:Aromatic-L-amino-acid decarboxylase n=1 Tax=Ceratocystis pirilliformis TaxID=259994 RepID=A0ABR3ZI82_9PEZI